MAKRYTFSVYIEAPEADEDGNGYTTKDVEILLSQTLNHWSAPLNKERRVVSVDFELMETEDMK